MKNFVCKGETIDYANSSGSTIASGSPVFVNNLPAIAQTDILDSTTGACALEGVFTLLKSAPLVITQGDDLYWNASTGVTKTTSDKPIGKAYASALSADVAVQVLLPETPAIFAQAADVATISTATATDLTTSEALANQLKTTVNAILDALKKAGIMA